MDAVFFKYSIVQRVLGNNSSENWFTVFGIHTCPAIPQQSTTCYRHYSWKKRTERQWFRNRSSTATQQISHAHTLEDKRREMHNSCPKNCMLLPEEIQHAASFTSPSRQQVAFILLQPPCSATLNHSETPSPAFREWKITYKMARPD